LDQLEGVVILSDVHVEQDLLPDDQEPSLSKEAVFAVHIFVQTDLDGDLIWREQASGEIAGAIRMGNRA
jgi:hypothetical protein